MTQAEQVKAKIIETVTGVAPTIHATSDFILPDDPIDAQTVRVPTLSSEEQEMYEAMLAGYPNVVVYRAIKKLEARVTELEAR
jgi:hypothetical protein